MQTRLLPLLVVLCLLVLSRGVQAQWVTEDYPLKAGWNAIWVSIDASHDTLENLTSGHVQDLGDGPVEVIEEVWYWNAQASSGTYITNPEEPEAASPEQVSADTRWFVYDRVSPENTTMASLLPNAAYLVRVAEGASDITLTLKGRPVPPVVSWNGFGLNFLGFPMSTPTDSVSQSFDAFLTLAQSVSNGADIFRYEGGALGDDNPVKVTTPRSVAVERGQAYWINSTKYSDYYGPLRVTIGVDGLDYGDTGSTLTLWVENVTDKLATATLTQQPSETAPAGQSEVAGAVPLKLRGEIDAETLQFAYTDLTEALSHDLEPGEAKEFVLSVDRPAMGGNAGDVFQSILQVTDSLGFLRVDLPVRAETTSRAGLWVGVAAIDRVDQITAAPVPLLDGSAEVNVSTEADSKVPSAFSMRVLLHRSESGALKLLQRVYLGPDAEGNAIITPSEAMLDQSRLAEARRLSSASFPLGENLLNQGSDLGLTGTSSFRSDLSYTAATNPFVHTYHPDHDNKDAQFSPTPLPEGEESYTVSREIDFSYVAEAAEIGLSEPGWGSTILGGHYQEQMSGLRAQPITIKGTFILRRVSSIGSLTE